MSERLNSALFFLLMLLVVVSPLPLGSNREWSWSLCAVIAGVLGLSWMVVNLGPKSRVVFSLPVWIPVSFALACSWAVIQTTAWTPASWHHPLWSMMSETLDIEAGGRVSLAPEDGWIALMRLLSYAVVFFLAVQMGGDRVRAQRAFGWLTVAGLTYAVFGLAVYWGGYDPSWLFGSRVLQHDVRSTFVNRNHFATWQGLTLLCAMAWFYQRMAKPSVKPYSMPQDREARVEAFILKAWKPLTVLLLIVASLMLTHSRGGFSAALAGTLVLFLLLDRRVPSKGARLRVTVFAALAVAGIAFYMTSEALLDRINRTDITTEERLVVYSNINGAIADNPVLGFGYGTFADSYWLYDTLLNGFHYDRAHNTWLENAFELGLPAAILLYLSLAGLVWVCFRGIRSRHRDWVYPATGVAASVLVGLHALLDFSLQIPAVAILYACIMGIACAQSFSSVKHG